MGITTRAGLRTAGSMFLRVLPELLLLLSGAATGASVESKCSAFCLLPCMEAWAGAAAACRSCFEVTFDSFGSSSFDLTNRGGGCFLKPAAWILFFIGGWEE